MTDTTNQNGGGKPSLIIPSGSDAKAALAGNLDDAGRARGAAAPAAVVRDWTEADARKALGLAPARTAWVTSNVGDPLVFAENERRKIWAVVGDVSPFDLIWNRTLLAVWKAPTEKDLGGGKMFLRTETHRDNDAWQGCVAMVLRLGPTAWVRDTDDDGKPVYFPQKPNVGDWVFFTRGYGTRIKINDFECIIVDKEMEAIKIILPYPHLVDIT